MNTTTKRILGAIAISAAVIAVLAMGFSLAYSKLAANPHPTTAVSAPGKPNTTSPTPKTAPSPTSNSTATNSPAPTPLTPRITPVPSATVNNPENPANATYGALHLANSISAEVTISQEEAIRIFQRLNTGQTLNQSSSTSFNAGQNLKSMRSDKYCVYYDVRFASGTVVFDTTFALLRDTSGFYQADSVNQKASAQLQSSIASGAPGSLTKLVQGVLDKVNADTTALGMLQAIYTGPFLTTGSGSGLLVSYDINTDRTVYTLTRLTNGEAAAVTAVTLPRTLKGCDQADVNNAAAIALLESGIAFQQNQATLPTEPAQASLREQASLQDIVKRALYVTILKRWLDPISDDTILSQDPTRFPATGVYINSINVTGNRIISDLTQALNVVNADGSNTLYTARGSVTEALNQTETGKITNTALISSLYSEMIPDTGYQSSSARNLYQNALAADEHISDLKDQQVQVPFPLKHSTGQVYKGAMLLQDPRTRVTPKDGLKVLKVQSSTADNEVLWVRYCKSGAIADTVFWLAKTPGGVDYANSHEIQEQATLKIYAIKFPDVAIDDLINIHTAVINQNNSIKKSGKSLAPVAVSNDELLRLKTQKIMGLIDPDIPVLIKSDPRPNGANGILAAKDCSVSSDGSYLNCYIQFYYRDTLVKREPVEIDFQLPITEYGRTKTALPAIQVLIKNPPATLPGEAGIPSMAEFLIKIQSYISSNLIPANILSN